MPRQLAALLIASVLIVALSPPLQAANTASGHFRMEKNTLVLKTVCAIALKEGETLVYMSDKPLDCAKAQATADPEAALDDQVMKGKAGEVRFKVSADGQPGTIFFMTNEPFDTFNAGGKGDFKLTTRSASRIEGRWVLAKPEEFFAKTFDFELVFAADVLGGKH